MHPQPLFHGLSISIKYVLRGLSFPKRVTIKIRIGTYLKNKSVGYFVTPNSSIRSSSYSPATFPNTIYGSCFFKLLARLSKIGASCLQFLLNSNIADICIYLPPIGVEFNKHIFVILLDIVKVFLCHNEDSFLILQRHSVLFFRFDLSLDCCNQSHQAHF